VFVHSRDHSSSVFLRQFDCQQGDIWYRWQKLNIVLNFFIKYKVQKQSIAKMDLIFTGWFSDLLRPRLDDLSLVMYTASMHKFVQGRSTFKFNVVHEYLAFAKLACIEGCDEILKWVINKINEDCPEEDMSAYGFRLDLFQPAVDNGNLDCVKTLVCEFNGHPCYFHNVMAAIHSVTSTNRASSRGRMEILQWAIDNGYRMENLPLCYHAAHAGNLEFMKYVYERGCTKWNENTQYTTTIAARNGHLECLIYAHEKGCRLDEKAMYFAAYYGNLDCYLYCRVSGVSPSMETIGIAHRNGWPEPRDD
jgi:hypothetical protein